MYNQSIQLITFECYLYLDFMSPHITDIVFMAHNYDRFQRPAIYDINDL